MKEHPILFSGAMVRALLDGKKTQTRRVVTCQPPADCSQLAIGLYHPTIIVQGDEEPGPLTFGAWSDDGEFGIRCPYGQPGDRMWVREAFFDHGELAGIVTPLTRDERIEYRASEWDRVDPTDGGPWKPSIHMPRWASRITLELTGIRVQRLQEISEDDCGAEGITSVEPGEMFFDFLSLWDSLNEKRGFGWNVNPWVWALTFKRAEVAE